MSETTAPRHEATDDAPPITFATYLTARERAALDARAAAAARDLATLVRRALDTPLSATWRGTLDRLDVALADASVPSPRAQEPVGVIRRIGEAIEEAMAPYVEALRRITERMRVAAEPATAASQADVEQLLAATRHALASADTPGERVEALRDLLDGWYGMWPETAVTDPHEPLAWELVRLLCRGEDQAND